MRDAPPGITTIARAMAVDAWTVEAVQALGRADVPAIVLKGPAFAQWLYDAAMPRPYRDADLLVPLDRLAAARDVLRGLGYQAAFSPDPPPGTIEHAAPWLRLADRAMIDLHHTISGASTSPERVWGTLSGRTEPLAVDGAQLRVLDLPGRALMVALHAAQHGPGSVRPLEDLRRAIRVGDAGTWRSAAELARGLDATAQLDAGLSLVPEGVPLARRLGLSGDAALASEPTALGFERLAATPGARAKLAVLAGEVVPSPRFLRWWLPWTRRGRLALAAGYAYRVVWLLAHSPSGWRAWRTAGRSVRRPGSRRTGRRRG